jgi:CheY-like chemotaxis protein/anti-sigma regulatory factor (Ser/Thr protein kinase)
MSHEIRTPLSVILGYAQILQRDHSLDMKHRDAVRKIETSGNHLLELINDLLDISKIETGEVELTLSDFDLHSLLLGLADMFRNQCEAKNIRFLLRGVGPSPIYVHGDERKLRQILVNLLGNAVKFTDQGEVTLTLENQPDNKFRFTISDTGNGIRPEDQVNIFELFKQGEEGFNKGGTGLGLAISWELSELMGGELSLESEVGQGASFSLTLELEPASPVPSRSRRSRQVKELSRKFDLKVLVVDNAEENREMLSEILKDIGAEVFAAKSGEKALEQLKDFIPDIIFMDMRMPVMSGEETTQKIIEQYGSGRFKIVGVSASTSAYDRNKMITAGCKTVISKPYRVEQIFKCLQDLLGVEYEYQEVPDDRQENTDKAPCESKELPDMCIPAKLFLEFKEKIEQSDISELEKLLEKLRTLGDEAMLVESHLRPLLKKGDFAGMLNFLENIPVIGVLHD